MTQENATVTLTAEQAAAFRKFEAQKAKAKASSDARYANDRKVKHHLIEQRAEYVDSPEFRGLGFSNSQVKTAVDFSNSERVRHALKADGTVMSMDEEIELRKKLGQPLTKAQKEYLGAE